MRIPIDILFEVDGFELWIVLGALFVFDSDGALVKIKLVVGEDEFHILKLGFIVGNFFDLYLTVGSIVLCEIVDKLGLRDVTAEGLDEVKLKVGSTDVVGTDVNVKLFDPLLEGWCEG